MRQLYHSIQQDHGTAVVGAENVKVAVNQALISGPIVLTDGDEIAFLPPVTGG